MNTTYKAGQRQRASRLLNPFAVFLPLLHNRSLVLQLTRREVLARYRGSLFGVSWALLSPLLMLITFTFVFSTIFQARWDSAVDSKSTFGLLLFAGLIVYWLFSDCVGRAPSLILENVAYVKRVVFPLEILPYVVLLGAAFHSALNFIVLLLGYWFFIGVPPLSSLYAPIVFVPLALLIMGASWLLAALGVYIRDTKQIVPTLLTLLLFMTPIFYPASAIPDWLRRYIELNPLAVIIEQLRAVLFFAHTPNWRLLLESTAIAWLVAWVGLVWFQTTRKGFADVV